jgi:Lipopolysaccharide export system permease LptF/LptG
MGHSGQSLQSEIRAMRMPGRWLRTAAARLCAKQTMERVIDPIVADVQTEYEEAMRTRGSWRAIWVCIRGYSAFWKAVGLYTLQSGPRSLWSGIAADGWTLGRMIAYSLIAFLGVTLLLSAPPMIHSYSRFGLKLTLLLLPQAIPLSIPIALPLGVVCGVYGTRVGARRIRGVLLLAVVATLLAFAAMLIVPVANQAFRVALAEELDLRGITMYSLPKGMNELSLSELASRSQEYDAGGFPQNARKFSRTYHIRFALPAATFVLSLLALGICGTLGGRAQRVAAIVIALGLYWAALALAEWTASLPPVVSVWAPNIVFTAMSLALLRVASGRAVAVCPIPPP